MFFSDQVFFQSRVIGSYRVTTDWIVAMLEGGSNDDDLDWAVLLVAFAPLLRVPVYLQQYISSVL